MIIPLTKQGYDYTRFFELRKLPNCIELAYFVNGRGFQWAFAIRNPFSIVTKNSFRKGG